MAGTPFKRALFKKIKEQGGWTWVFERIASGDTVLAIATDLGCSRSFLNGLLRTDPKRREIYEAARKESAEALIEKSALEADNVGADRDEIQRARLRIEERRYRAGVYDREQFGEQTKSVGGVVVNIGQLHLDALRQRILPAPAPAPLALPLVKDAELEPEPA